MSKKEKLLHHIHLWFLSWVELVQSIVKILSFTFVLPSWDFDYIIYRNRKLRAKREKYED